MTRILVSTIENSPGRVHVGLYDGQGVDAKAMRKELSLSEMRFMHQVLTKALWDIALQDAKMMEELKRVASLVVDSARSKTV